MPAHSADGYVEVTGYGYFYVIEDEMAIAQAPARRPGRRQGWLADAVVRGLIISTKIDTGLVYLTIEVHALPPTIEPPGEWDDTDEIEFESESGELYITGFADSDVMFPQPVPVPENSHLAARVRFRIRTGQAESGTHELAEEQYFIQIWPVDS